MRQFTIGRLRATFEILPRVAPALQPAPVATADFPGPDPMLSFELFQGTREACADIGAVISADMGREKPVSGNLYLGTFYIEAVDSDWFDSATALARGKWYLILERDELISDDLEMLERKLYEFAVASGHGEFTTTDLCADYEAWNKRQGLWLGSADEHWHDETLTESHLAWVRNFSARWDIAAEAERAATCHHRDDGRGRCIDCAAFI